MNPAHVLFLSFTCGIFAVILVWVNNPMARVFWCLTAICALAAVIPAILLDLGMYFAQCRYYKAGAQLIEWAEWLCRYISGRHTKLMAAVYDSRVELMQGNSHRAVFQARRAIDLHNEDDHWLSLFFALTAAGNACWSIKDYEQAEAYFNQAWEASGGYSGFTASESISDAHATVHADNLNTLALIEVRKGDFDKARRLFERSSKLRKETTPLQASSEAYDEFAQGLLALANGNKVQCTDHMLCAAGLLPRNLLLSQHFRVAVDILCVLRTLESVRATEVFTSLFQTLEGQLHPYDLRLISTPPIDQPEHSSSFESTRESSSSFLSNIEERLFKRLPADMAVKWQERFHDSLVESDLHRLWIAFVLWLLEDSEEGAIKYVSMPQDREAIQHVAMLYRNGCSDKTEWKLASGAAHGAAKAAKANKERSGGVHYDHVELVQSALSVAAMAADASTSDNADRAGLVIDVAAGLAARVELNKTRSEAGKEAWGKAMNSAYLHISQKLIELSDIKPA